MELSKAPRLTPFTAWGRSCVGASVLAGSKGAAGGGGGGGGGGGNADIPGWGTEKGDSQYHLYQPPRHTCYCSVLGRRDFDEPANVFLQRDQDTQFYVFFFKC